MHGCIVVLIVCEWEMYKLLAHKVGQPKTVSLHVCNAPLPQQVCWEVIPQCYSTWNNGYIQTILYINNAMFQLYIHKEDQKKKKDSEKSRERKKILFVVKLYGSMRMYLHIHLSRFLKFVKGT
jgi:hypothetical protein